VTASAALMLLAAASVAPPTALQCPAIAGQSLTYIDIYDGTPDKQVDLAPDQTQKQAGTMSNMWRLFPSPAGLYVKCGYGKSLAGAYTRTELIRLPSTAKTCRADFRSGPGAGDLTLLRFSCQ
jgi:hypothetical protein